jgi:hypothetical protein
MHEYTGAKDGMRCSEEELDPKVIEKRIRLLMKSPRKKPLKFGMALFENGSCPPVHCSSATVHMIPFYFMGLTFSAFHFQLKSLGPTDFAHPIRQSTPQPAADDKEEVHSSGNKEEMATDGYQEARW